jgi:hypothetical protein
MEGFELRKSVYENETWLLNFGEPKPQEHTSYGYRRRNSTIAPENRPTNQSFKCVARYGRSYLSESERRRGTQENGIDSDEDRTLKR